jgi:hypothetical protein
LKSLFKNLSNQPAKVLYWLVYDPKQPGTPPRAQFRSLTEATEWASLRGYTVSAYELAVPSGVQYSREELTPMTDRPPIAPGHLPILAFSWVKVVFSACIAALLVLCFTVAVPITWKTAEDRVNGYVRCDVIFNAGWRIEGASQPSYELVGRGWALRSDTVLGRYPSRGEAETAKLSASECK